MSAQVIFFSSKEPLPPVEREEYSERISVASLESILLSSLTSPSDDEFSATPIIGENTWQDWLGLIYPVTKEWL